MQFEQSISQIRKNECTEKEKELEKIKQENQKKDSGMAQYRYYKEDTRKEIEGYQQEAPAGKKVHPVNRMANSYGDISFGVAADKTVTLMVSEKKRKDGKGISNDHMVLKEAGAKKEKAGAFFLKTNTLDKENSAAILQGTLKTTPEKFLAALRKTVVQKNQNTMERMLPFTEEKQKLLLNLRQEQRNYLEAKEHKQQNRQRYHLLEEKKKELQHEVIRDRQEEKKTLLWIADAMERAKKQQQRQAERVWYHMVQQKTEEDTITKDDTIAEENENGQKEK